MAVTNDAALELDPELINDLSQSVSSRIANLLERSILQGRYPPGHRLREVELANQLGVSRTPLREAFYLLEMKGLIEIQPRRGTFVKTVTVDEMDCLLTIRVCLDGLAASLAAEHAEPDSVARMRKVLAAQREARENDDHASYHRLGQEFHNLVYVTSKNRKLDTIYQSLRVESALYPVADIMLPGEMEKSIEEHRRLLDAIASGDAATARTIAERHIERVKTHLRANLPDNAT